MTPTIRKENPLPLSPEVQAMNQVLEGFDMLAGAFARMGTSFQQAANEMAALGGVVSELPPPTRWERLCMWISDLPYVWRGR